jgi:hypothetical protein
MELGVLEKYPYPFNSLNPEAEAMW